MCKKVNPTRMLTVVKEGSNCCESSVMFLKSFAEALAQDQTSAIVLYFLLYSIFNKIYKTYL